MSDPYFDLVFRVQALRRRVERHLHLDGALGIAAQLWPHQVANVARVLRDTRVRHLLADEVGLGKTVQAMMVLKALLLNWPELRVGILVPDKLKQQWLEELLARANIAVTEDQDLEGDEQRPILLWPSARGIAEVDFSSFDFLIVDELPRLTRELQERVLRASADLSHLLILTATPPLENPQRAYLFMQLIEPTRALLAGEDPVPWMREREKTVLEQLGHWSADFLAGPPPDPSSETAALAYAATRRLFRTRRTVWRNYLPTRTPRIRIVEPTDIERKRQELLWKWIRTHGKLDREIDIAALAQRVRSPASLRQRVYELRGRGNDHDSTLAELGRTFDGSPGDSRFEALLDTLLGIWRAAPSEKVVIAVNDNTTLDELAKLLPRAFDAMEPSSQPLRIAQIRNQAAGTEDLVDVEDPIATAARQFWSGEAQVLLLAEAGTAGLNLQCARHIVLYSVPWDPVEVEQLIGRIDRIGNAATKRDGLGQQLPLEVHVICQRGLVDHRVLGVIQATRLLEQSISLDSDDLEQIRRDIQDAALSSEARPWAVLVAQAQALSHAPEDELRLPLQDFLPTTPERSEELYRTLCNAPPAEPVLGSPRAGEAGWSDALKSWLQGLDSAELYKLTKDRVSGLHSLGYFLPARRISAVTELPTRSLKLLPEPKSLTYFRLYRKNLEANPQLARKENRNLRYFFDHGSQLHEELVDAWLTQERSARFSLIVSSPHPLAHLAGAVLRVKVALLDAGQLLPPSSARRPELEADRRFVHGLLPSSVISSALAIRQGLAAPVSDADLRALLTPDLKDDGLKRRVDAWRPPVWWTNQLESRADTALSTYLLNRARSRWSTQGPALAAAVSARCYVLSADALDAEELTARDQAALEEQMTEAEHSNSLLAARIKRRLETLLSADHERKSQEVLRSAWLQGLLNRNPADALCSFADAWILLKA